MGLLKKNFWNLIGESALVGGFTKSLSPINKEKGKTDDEQKAASTRQGVEVKRVVEGELNREGKGSQCFLHIRAGWVAFTKVLARFSLHTARVSLLSNQAVYVLL